MSVADLKGPSREQLSRDISDLKAQFIRHTEQVTGNTHHWRSAYLTTRIEFTQLKLEMVWPTVFTYTLYTLLALLFLAYPGSNGIIRVLWTLLCVSFIVRIGKTVWGARQTRKELERLEQSLERCQGRSAGSYQEVGNEGGSSNSV